MLVALGCVVAGVVAGAGANLLPVVGPVEVSLRLPISVLPVAESTEMTIEAIKLKVIQLVSCIIALVCWYNVKQRKKKTCVNVNSVKLPELLVRKTVKQLSDLLIDAASLHSLCSCGSSRPLHKLPPRNFPWSHA